MVQCMLPMKISERSFSNLVFWIHFPESGISCIPPTSKIKDFSAFPPPLITPFFSPSCPSSSGGSFERTPFFSSRYQTFVPPRPSGFFKNLDRLPGKLPRSRTLPRALLFANLFPHCGRLLFSYCLFRRPRGRPAFILEMGSVARLTSCKDLVLFCIAEFCSLPTPPLILIFGSRTAPRIPSTPIPFCRKVFTLLT